MGTLTLCAHALGRSKPIFPDWEFPWPPVEGGRSEPCTLRQIITRIVHEEVLAFEKRQEERKLERILTVDEIQEGEDKGKIAPEGRKPQCVDADESVSAALQAFEDGIYLVFVDDQEQRNLDQQFFLKSNSHLKFVRLVMLAGG